MTHRFACSLVLLLSTTTGVFAQQSARELGSAGSLNVISQGVDAIYGNPALLGLPHRGAQVQIRFINAFAAVRNNAWDWNDYDTYYDKDLTGNDRTAVLDKVPQSGLEVNSLATLHTLGIRIKSLGLLAGAFEMSDLLIDKKALELLLLGNPDGLTEVRLLQKNSEAMAGWRVGIVYGRYVGEIGGKPIYAGINLSKLFGLYYGISFPAELRLTQPGDSLWGYGSAMGKTAEGGDGWSSDGGIAIELSDKWTASFTVENIIHTIRWKKETVLHRATFELEGLHIDRFDEIDDAFDEGADGTELPEEPAARFNSGLPVNLRTGIGCIGRKNRFAVMATLGFKDRLCVSTKPGLALGGETRYIPLLPLRAGCSVGGGSGFQVAAGFGIWLPIFRLDLGIMMDNPFNYKSRKGVSIGLSIDSPTSG